MQINKETIRTDYGLPVHFFYSHDGQPSNILPHFHDDIEIIYLLTGSLHVYTDNKLHNLMPNDYIVFNTNCIHSITSPDSNVTAYVLQISYSFLSNCLSESGNEGIYFNVPIESETAIPDTQMQYINEMKKYLADLYGCFWPPSEYSSLKIMGLVYQLLYTLTKNFRIQSPVDESRKISVLRQLSVITEYIGAHYMEPCFLPELSALVNYSPSYLSRCFKQYMGLTISDYITLTRLEHAYLDIVTTDIPVMYVSEKNGFSSYNFFNSKFKERYNHTPTRVRQLVKENIVIK